MPRHLQVLDVFVASPGDVGAEREGLEQVVEDLNVGLRVRGVELRLFKWESDVVPGLGVDAQDVVNRQSPATTDIFLGIVWSRIGTPTGRARSGTVEEFERAHAQWRLDPDSIEVMLYFKTDDIPFDQIDPDQFRSVREFRARVRDSGAFAVEFRKPEDFLSLARKHLLVAALKFDQRADAGNRPTSQAPIAEPELSSLQAHRIAQSAPPTGTDTTTRESPRDDEETPGLLDILTALPPQTGRLLQITTSLTSRMNELTEQFNSHSTHVQALNVDGRQPSPEEAMRVLDSMGSHMEVFAAGVDSDAPMLAAALQELLDGMDDALALAPRLGPEAVRDILGARESLSGFEAVLTATVGHIGSFAKTVSSFPPLTTRLSRTKRRCAEALGKLEVTVRKGQEQIAATLQVMDQLAAEAGDTENPGAERPG